jgi:hypothetical protein
MVPRMGHDRIHQFEERAEEIRSCAENMRTIEAKADLLRIAECYDRMADREKAAYAVSSASK